MFLYISENREKINFIAFYTSLFFATEDKKIINVNSNDRLSKQL